MVTRLILGLRPSAESAEGDGDFWASRTGEAIVRLASDISAGRFTALDYWRSRCDVANVYPYPPWGERRRLTRAEVHANGHAARVMERIAHADRVLVLGSEPVWLLTGVRCEVTLQRYTAGGTFVPRLGWLDAIPHPSPRNRSLSDPAKREALGRFLYEWITRD